jgi:ribonuclease J
MPLQDLQEITLGDFKLQIIEVDHDSPGVSGFILRTNEHTIAFTADWRRHGRHSYRMDRFIKLCREAEVDVLITEGTRLRPDTLFRKPIDRQELEVAATYHKVLEQAEGLVYVNILARNVERVADIIMATKTAGRTLVMDESTAVLWYVATQEGIVALEDHPALQELETIRVLPNSGPGAMNGAQHKLPYAPITLAEMIADKSRFAMYLTYQQLPLMAELERLGQLAAPSQYVHANGNPLNHSDETLLRWLSEFGVTYHYCATGGHAAPQEISDLVEGIQPKVVIPLHSVHPTLFDSRGVPRFYPTYGETVELNQLIGAYAPIVK